MPYYATFTPQLLNLFLVNILLLLTSLSALIVNAVMGYEMPKKTDLGVAAKHKYMDLKKFIKEYPLEEGRVFDTYLPEAIALGEQKKWVKKAEELGYQPNWYKGGEFNYYSFNAFYIGFMSAGGGTGGGGGGGGGFGGGGGAGGGGGGAG
jgi:uncharacterized membrane protein